MKKTCTPRSVRNNKYSPYPFLPRPLKLSEQSWNENVMPLVSVSCQAYMHAPFIREAIEGFLMQETTFRVEIVIHDDASTDGTTDIIREYEKKHPHLFTCFYQTENTYIHPEKTALRKPFKEAKLGKYVALCEGDDYWTDPLKLQKQFIFLEEHPEYSFCVGGFMRLYDDTKQHVSRLRQIKENDTGKSGYTFSLPEMQRNWLTQPLTAMYRRALLKHFDLSKYKYTRDVHLFYHLAKTGKAFYFTEYFGVHRFHPGGVHSMQGKKKTRKTAYLIYNELYKVNRDTFTRRKLLISIKSIVGRTLFDKTRVVRLIKIPGLVLKGLFLIRPVADFDFFFRSSKSSTFNAYYEEDNH